MIARRMLEDLVYPGLERKAKRALGDELTEAIYRREPEITALGKELEDAFVRTIMPKASASTIGSRKPNEHSMNPATFLERFVMLVYRMRRFAQ
jgi:hypothetical protein